MSFLSSRGLPFRYAFGYRGLASTLAVLAQLPRAGLFGTPVGYHGLAQLPRAGLFRYACRLPRPFAHESRSRYLDF
jgi:hypothetical protein